MITIQEKKNIQNYLTIGTLVFILILSVFLRFSALSGTTVDTPIRADAAKYLSYALNLNTHHTYSGRYYTSKDSEPPKPDAVITPGYPLFISLFIDEVSSTTMKHINTVLLMQTLLSCLTVLLTYFIFSSIIGRWPSLVVSFLTGISPHLINANVYLLTESLFCFLLISFLFALFKLGTRFSLASIFFCGALLAAASLTRSWAQYFIIFLIPMIYWASNAIFAKKYLITSFIGGYIMVFSIWVIRNYIVIGSSGDSSLMLATLHHGMYPGMMYNFMPESLGVPYRFDPDSSKIVSSLSAFLNELLIRVKADPWSYIQWYSVGKANMVLSWNIVAGYGDSFIYPILKTPYQNDPVFTQSHLIMRTLHNPLNILAVLGAVMAWWPAGVKGLSIEASWMLRVISLLFIYFLLIHTIAAPFPRYSIPIRPITYGLAIFSLIVGFDMARQFISSRKLI